jgi:hypothetical protein
MQRPFKQHRSEGQREIGHADGAAPGSATDEASMPARYWSPEFKAEQRAQQRAQQKEADTSMEYFRNVENALVALAAQRQQEEANAVPTVEEGANGEEPSVAGAPSSSTTIGTEAVLDGFCTELTKLLNREAKTLLSSRIVCKTIELALSAAGRKHVAVLAYSFLGRIGMMSISPTASFVVETLLAAIYKALGTSSAADAVADAEDNRGMPGLPDVLRLLVNELCEAVYVSGLLWDRGGSKCVASALLICAGFPVRGVPEHDEFRNGELVLNLFAALRPQLEKTSQFGGTRDSFADACVHVSACFVVQALIRAAAAFDLDDETFTGLRQYLHNNLVPILGDLMQDKVGTRVVECYASTGDTEAWQLVLQLAKEAMKSKDGFVPVFAINSLIEGCTSAATLTELWNNIFNADESTLSGWVTWRSSEPLTQPKHHQQQQQPTQAPHPLCRFVERLAPATDIAASGMEGAPTKTVARRGERPIIDEIPAALRTEVMSAVCAQAKSSKGPAHALLVGGIAGRSGLQLCADLLRFGRTAAVTLVRSIMKIPTADIPAVADTPLGSIALQRFIDLVAPESAMKVQVDTSAEAKDEKVEMVPLSGGALRMWYKERRAEQAKLGAVGKALAPPPKVPLVPAPKKAGAKKPQEPAAPAQDASILLKFARRVAPSVIDMAKSKHGSFVVQHLYAQGAVDVREALCQVLANAYTELKTDFVASKVLVKCHVEQFLYRPDEWRLQSTKQAHLRRVMAAVVAAEAAYESKKRPATAHDADGAAATAAATAPEPTDRKGPPRGSPKGGANAKTAARNPAAGKKKPFEKKPFEKKPFEKKPYVPRAQRVAAAPLAQDE